MADQLCGGGNRQEEETGILLAGAVIVQDRVEARPVPDAVLYDRITPKQGIAKETALLHAVKNSEHLPLCTKTQPVPQFRQTADPFAGINRIGNSVKATIGRAEVRVGTEYGKMKKTGISVGTDVPVSN